LARVIIATFEQAGLGVSHARTCEEAVQLCRAVTPSLLILDLSLPDGDGLTFVQWLRSSHQLSRLPMIVYSAREVAEDERSRLRLGPTEFLTKARVQPKEIEALVRSMLHPEREARDSATQEGATREGRRQAIAVADDFLSSTPLEIRGQWDVAY
jgi:DNA-binding response OmpR family regulator